MTDKPSQASWIDLGPLADFPTDQHRCVTQQSLSLVVLNVADEIYVLENNCPHASRPLGDGERAGMTLICPYHGYTYHIKTGRNIDYPDDTPARTFPARIHDGMVQALIPVQQDEPETHE